MFQHLTLHCKQFATQHVQRELKCLCFWILLFRNFPLNWDLSVLQFQTNRTILPFSQGCVRVITNNTERISVTVIQESSCPSPLHPDLNTSSSLKWDLKPINTSFILKTGLCCMVALYLSLLNIAAVLQLLVIGKKKV